MPLIYAFDHRHRRAPMELKDQLGGKGANLAEMTSVLGLPVPPGFTITTDACRSYMHDGWPAGLDAELDRHLAKLEKAMRAKLGDPSDPLLVSVRSGAKFSMPGMMDTVLNLGLNDRSVKGLARQTGDERFAYGSYARLLSMFGKVVRGIDGEVFDEPQDAAKAAEGVTDVADLSAAAWKALCTGHKRAIREHSKKPFPQDPRAQLDAAIDAVFGSWNGDRAIALPRAREDQQRARHRGQRPGDGLRQPRRQLRHRCGLHP